MKLVFLVIAILINFFHHSLIKSEEKIDLGNKKIESIAKKESINEDKTEKRKIHIVQIGDTVTSIAKFYSVNKSLIIQLNNLKDENYIFAGQNLAISGSTENASKQPNLVDNYHTVQIGENLTEISNNYDFKINDLIEINKLKNPDSIEVGQKIFFSKKKPIRLDNYQINDNEKRNESLKSDKKMYGPIVIQGKPYRTNKDRKVFNVLNQENKKLILSINCDTNDLDVRIPGRKWMGNKPAQEDFERNLINDFC